LDRVNAEVLATQETYCTDAEREEEYGRCLHKVLGVDPHFNPSLFAEAETGGQTLAEIIEELERKADLLSSQEV